MTPAVETRGLTWTPLGRRDPVLDGVDLRVGEGERVLVTGPSGGGKSTLLRALAGLLDAGGGGELGGEVRVRGHEAAAGDAALLVQDPRDARVAEHAGRDVAFACENAAVPRAAIAQRVAWALDAVGFPYGPDHPSAALSGGEAQRLALAGVVAARPELLLLDEPTSMLDDAAALAVREAVASVVADRATTLIVVEHRLGGWLRLVDRLVVLGAAGRIVADGAPDAVLSAQASFLVSQGVWVPGAPDPAPLVVPTALVAPAHPIADGQGVLVRAAGAGLVRPAPRRLLHTLRSAPVVALAGVDVAVAAGRFATLRGPSGSGKSSLLDLLCGLDAPTAGAVRASAVFARGADEHPHRWSSPELAERVGWVPQDASTTVVGATVGDSLAATARALGHPAARIDARVAHLAEVLGLTGVLGRHPHRLSGGETRRLAVASSLAHGPGLLALDEPTVGQDRRTWAAVAGLALAARDAGVGVVAATHDTAFAALADDACSLESGRVVTP